MSKTVGYLEGTDPRLLNDLVARGIGTMPLSNGFDSHGKQVSYLTRQDSIDLVVGWFYKAVPPPDMKLTLRDIFFSCTTYRIPVLLIAATNIHKVARQVEGGLPEEVKLVPPEKITGEVLRLLGTKSAPTRKQAARRKTSARAR